MKLNRPTQCKLKPQWIVDRGLSHMAEASIKEKFHSHDEEPDLVETVLRIGGEIKETMRRLRSKRGK